MITLGMETSGRAASVALCSDGKILEERWLDRHGRRHAQTLVAEIDRLTRESEIRLRDLDAVAVSIGPGSFTGLRIGVTCAKTLAYATGCQVAGVDTLLCIAENSPADVAELFVISDAGRGELYAGHYARGDDGFYVRDGEIVIVSAGPWCSGRAAGDVVSGPGVDKYANELPAAVRQLEPPLRLPRAGVVARLGERRILAGRADDLWPLEPFYLRPSAAEEKRDAAR